MSDLRVFIGYDPRQPIAFQVCAQSIWEHASKPVSITRLDLKNLPITRRGLTEFTYSRFLVPYLSGFAGDSLFLDSDILVRGDIVELFDMAKADDATSTWLWYVDHQGQRAFERSSVMLFYNSVWKNRLTPEFIEDPANKLFDFKWAMRTAPLPKEWNHLVGYDPPNPHAKIVHFTMGIPIWKETIKSEFAQEWIDTYKRMNGSVSFEELMGRSVHVPHIETRMITLPGILSTAERHAQMALAIKSGFPFLRRAKKFHGGEISIVCFGPSLLETWPQINRRDYLPIISVSGAHDFLLERWITPTYHVHIDPRPFEPEMLAKPNEHTKYLMATVCPPDFWTLLKKRHVELWHLINGPETVDWVRMNHSRGLKSMMGGGSTVGQRAMNVAAALGYRRFRVYGMDLSFGYQHWAGPHPGNDEPLINVEYNGRVFKTTPQLAQSAQEMAQFIRTMDVEIEFHGDGLMQEIAKVEKGRK